MNIRKKMDYGTSDLEKEIGKLTFGNVLLSHRLCEELTQVEMARKLGISKQSLCDLEKGRKIPSPKRASQIAKKLKMHPESFIELAIKDLLEKEKLYYEVSLSKANSKKAG